MPNGEIELRNRRRRVRLLLAATLLGVSAQDVPGLACGCHSEVSGGRAPAHLRSVEVALVLRAALDKNVVEAPAPHPPWAQLARVGRLRQRPAVADDSAPPLPPVALALIEDRLWARYSPDEGKVSLAPHVPGPSAGDVIAVTGMPTLKALLDGSLSAETAISGGILVVTGPSSSALRVEEALRGAFDRGTSSDDHPELK